MPRTGPAAPHRIRHDLRAKLEAGDTVRGFFVKLPGRASIDLAASNGFDLVVIDLEHSTLTEADALDLCAHAAAIGLAAIVRLAAVDAGAINRLLEVGAAGIQLSTLRSTADARALRSATRHSPEGSRSISLAHATAGYGTVDLTTHLAAEAAAPPLVVGQIETAVVDDPLEDILEPLDVAFIGTTDLSVDLGLPGRADDERMIERTEAIAAAARATATILGSFAGTPGRVPDLIAGGNRYLVIGSDVALLAGAIAAISRALDPEPSEEDPS